MVRSIEAFLNIQFKVKGKHIFVLFLILCFPALPIQAFSVFFLALRALGRDIQDKNIITAVLSLPFKKRELFFSSWVFGLLVILVGSAVSWIFGGFVNIYTLSYLSIFFTFYYGISTYFASTEHSVFGMTLLIFILDVILLSVPGYDYISVITQKNVLYSSFFALLVLGLGYYSFVYKYET